MQGAHEEIRVVQAFKPVDRSSADTLYNGVAAGSSADKGIDLRGFDEALVIVQAGVINASVTSVVYTPQTKAANTNTAEDATSVASTDLTSSALTLGPSDDNKTKLIRVRCRDVGRYLFIKRVQTGAASILDSVIVLLTKAQVVPVTNDSAIDATVSTSFTHSN